MNPINWTKIQEELKYDPQVLIDIFFRNIVPERWFNIIKWIQKHPALVEVDWYDPETDMNYDAISEKTYEALDRVNFYIHANLRFGKILLAVHYFLSNEIECDINPDGVSSESDFMAVLDILDELASVAQVKEYTIQPEVSDHIIFRRILP